MSTTDVRAPLLPVSTTLNGKDVVLQARAGERLLDVLRAEGCLTGVKEGCGEGECGACAVLLDDKVVCSCVTLAQTVDGCRVTTIEGLAARAKLPVHPMQQRFVEEMGTQCGFCTPGMVIAACALLEEKPQATRAEIEDGISGNLCRCTGYARIVKAVEKARDDLAKR